MKKCLPGFLLIFVVLIFVFNPVYGQKAATHDLGKLYVAFQGDNQNILEGYRGIAQFQYPNGWYNRQMLMMWTNVFTAKNWIDENGDKPDIVHWTPEKNNPGMGRSVSMTTYKRFKPCTIIIDNRDITMLFIGIVDPSIPSDIYTNYVYRTADVIGLESTSQHWTYTNTNHDDYMLIRQDVTFTGDLDADGERDLPDQTIQLAWADCFAPDIPRAAAESLPSRTDWYSGHSWSTWDSYNNYMDLNKWPILVTGKSRNDLLISYNYNDDDINYKAPRGYDESEVINYYDSRGVPDPKTGMFLAAAYEGMAIFHTDKSATNTSDDITNPKSLSWTGHSDYWSKMWRNGIWDFITNPTNRTLPKWEYEGFAHNEMSGTQNMFQVQGVGPYDISIGQDFTAVYAIAAGSIDQDVCYTEGQKWWNWYWDLSGEKLDNAGKNALIATSKDSLFLNLNRAYWAYSKNYDIPDPLPAPNIEVSSGPDRNEIEWGYSDPSFFKDPDTGADDFYQWRLYRKKGAFEVDHVTDIGNYYPYELIGTFDRGTTSYMDNSAERGVAYHYCVTAVDDGSQNTSGLFPGQKLESSYYANRTPLAVVAFKPGLNISDEVVVVPNPYSVSTGIENMMNWPGAPNQVRFMNLPAYCTLKIYTSTGDLVKTIDHQSGSGDEAWINLRTDFNQYPSSGVYILVVDDPKDLEKNPLPRQFVKFVIVR